MTRARVAAWRDALRASPLPEVGLSPAGARLALDVALDALTDDVLARVEGPRVGGTATLVCARTVFTAPIEWCAVAWLLGVDVELKLPSSGGILAFAELMSALAGEVGLRLRLSRGHETPRSDRLVVMGSDATVAALRPGPASSCRFLGFGHKFSAAYVHDGDWESVASDATLHDGRGCLSPVVVLTPRADAVPGLARAMALAEDRYPRGEVAPVEHAALRHRGALARVVGEVAEGPGWQVAALPLAHWRPMALPRAVVVVPVDGPDAAAAALRHRPTLSTVGTDRPLDLPAPQVSLGAMQRPPLFRTHDGVDWIAWWREGQSSSGGGT